MIKSEINAGQLNLGGELGVVKNIERCWPSRVTIISESLIGTRNQLIRLEMERPPPTLRLEEKGWAKATHRPKWSKETYLGWSFFIDMFLSMYVGQFEQFIPANSYVYEAAGRCKGLLGCASNIGPEGFSQEEFSTMGCADQSSTPEWMSLAGKLQSNIFKRKYSAFLGAWSKKSQSCHIISHRIKVWYIYLYLVDFFMVNVHKYIFHTFPYFDPMG